MSDFTITSYQSLLDVLQARSFTFQTFALYLKSAAKTPLILRHDVDLLPHNSLRFAEIQAERGIQATYYFRAVPQSYDEAIIRSIAELGHEIGYHYETMDHCRGDVDKAYEAFCQNLEKFRKLAPIETISMHGSPLSKYDNRTIWKKYDYKSLGLIGEPYFDIDFNTLYYLTDTGRRWDGHLFNVRDKATADNPLTNPEFLKLRFHSTQDIISAIEKGQFPKQAMLNFHPQRWHDKSLPWLKELIWQNVKNVGKYLLVKKSLATKSVK